MNKLVSKNPVLRFKLGRKIVKALGGLPMVINTVGGVPAVRNTIGGVPSVRPTTVSGVPATRPATGGVPATRPATGGVPSVRTTVGGVPTTRNTVRGVPSTRPTTVRVVTSPTTTSDVRVVDTKGVGGTRGASPKVSTSGTGSVPPKTSGVSPKTVRGVPAVRNTVGGVPSVVSKTASTAGKVGRGLLGGVKNFLKRNALGLAVLAGAEVGDHLGKSIWNYLRDKERDRILSERDKRRQRLQAYLDTAKTAGAFGGPDLSEIDKIAKPKSTKNTNSENNSSNVSRRPLKTKEWESEFNNAKNQLSAQQLMYLNSLGIDTSSAEKMQQSINNYNKNSGLVVDNKWGNKSSTALSKILSSMPNDYRNEDTLWGLDNEKNVPDAVPTKPTVNLGYRTSNTYENNDFSDRLRNMGIRSNADLIDFMHRTNGENYDWNGDNWARQFRSDVNQALGGDYSDANIRRVFNTQGNWGRGFLGRGDIRDFQTALQTNAGTWNGSYDRNLGNYVKNMDWSKFKLYKQGGQLISRNPIKRFKLRTKI